MADKHPYISGGGILVQVIKNLRNSFPEIFNADTLKKLGLAPKNESYVINVLRYLNIIDDDGKRNAATLKVFTQHDDKIFAKQFSDIVKSAYKDLFDLYGDNAWNQSTDALITFFRSSDNTSAIVGKRQALTFQVLAALSGHGETPEPKKMINTKKAVKKKKSKLNDTTKNKLDVDSTAHQMNDTKQNFGLTVRIEINLPADGSQDTYDNIFRSIRENLLNE